MKAWTNLTKEERQTILTNIADEKGIVENAVEKDYWVSMTLRSIFSLPRRCAGVQRRHQSQQRMESDRTFL